MSEAICLQFMIYFDETGVSEWIVHIFVKNRIKSLFFLQFKYHFKISQLIV